MKCFDFNCVMWISKICSCWFVWIFFYLLSSSLQFFNLHNCTYFTLLQMKMYFDWRLPAPQIRLVRQLRALQVSSFIHSFIAFMWTLHRSLQLYLMPYHPPTLRLTSGLKLVTWSLHLPRQRRLSKPVQWIQFQHWKKRQSTVALF